MKEKIKLKIDDLYLDELWVVIDGYNSNYAISNYGRLCNINTLNILTFEDKGGYKYYRLDRKHGRKRLCIHRLVAIYFIENTYNKPFVNHINGLKSDNRVCNLEWCTQKENIEHAIKTGLFNTEKRRLYLESKKGFRPPHLNGIKLFGSDNGKSIPVETYDANGILINTYESQNLCAKDLGTRQSNIHRAIVFGYKCKGVYIRKQQMFNKVQ